jgi:hypothetical protein
MPACAHLAAPAHHPCHLMVRNQGNTGPSKVEVITQVGAILGRLDGRLELSRSYCRVAAAQQERRVKTVCVCRVVRRCQMRKRERNTHSCQHQVQAASMHGNDGQAHAAAGLCYGTCMWTTMCDLQHGPTWLFSGTRGRAAVYADKKNAYSRHIPGQASHHVLGRVAVAVPSSWLGRLASGQLYCIAPQLRLAAAAAAAAAGAAAAAEEAAHPHYITFRVRYP